MLRFRNLTVTPDDPVEEWGTEGLLTAVDRGSLQDWRRIVTAIRLDPFSATAAQLEAALALAEDAGVVTALRRQLTAARDRSARAAVVERLTAAAGSFGGSAAAFARVLGTSPSRMSTYLNGSVMPSAALLVKAESVAAAASQQYGRDEASVH